jgi:release factor glutamine methyltransferase
MAKSYNISQVLKEAERVLTEGGISEAARNALLLLQYQLKMDTASLIANSKERVSSGDLAQYSALVSRRLQREPIQYITRSSEFWGLDFYVDQRVLIPRPETEHIIEEVMKDYPDTSKNLSIVDVGVGSGCISISLAKEYPRAKLFAIDSEAGPLEIAAINSSRHNVTSRINLLKGHILEPAIALKSPKAFNIVVSNPPYIAESEIKNLEPEVIDAEPKKALVSGPTGYEMYQELVESLPKALRKKGYFYLEIGAGQSKEICSMIDDIVELEIQRVVNDLQDIPRVIVGSREK